LHVTAAFATLAAGVTAYDFDPTTFSKKSDMTRSNKNGHGFYPMVASAWEAN
jgi:hypothetical protein